MAKTHVTLNLNGESTELLCEPRQMLLEVLRDELDLTGTKEGCATGDCGACSVLLDGRVVCACLVLAVETEGRTLTTVEGLADGEKLHPLQKAFLENFSFQCGYSAPGFLMASYCLLDRLKRSPVPKEDVDAAIHDAVGQHVCRCTGYVRYYRAIRQVILATPGLVA